MTQSHEYKGYVLIQVSYNRHYIVLNEKGELVMRAPADHMLTEQEARDAIDGYLALMA